MKKTLILIITIALVLTIAISYNIFINRDLKRNISKINKEYESFYNIDILGTDIASLINRIDNDNKNNNVEKDSNGNYIDNNKNSIKADVKFLELEDNISIEKIENQGINQFVQNFGAMKFRCTKIEYHKSTGAIQYMYIEQIEN